MIAAGLAAGSVLALARGAGPGRVRVLDRPDGGPSVEDRLRRRVIAADLPFAAARPLVSWLAVGAVATGVAVAVASVPVALGVLAAVSALPPAGLALRGDRSGVMLVRQLPAFVDGVSRQLRVGRSLSQALDELRRSATHPLDRDLDGIVTRVRAGRSMVDELHGWARRRGEVDLHLVVTALTVGHVTGGHRAAALDGVVGSIRDRQAVAGELEALTAQARTSAAVVALAPPGFTVILAVVGIAPTVSWERPAIAASVAIGLALDVGGLVWMRRLATPRW